MNKLDLHSIVRKRNHIKEQLEKSRITMLKEILKQINQIKNGLQM